MFRLRNVFGNRRDFGAHQRTTNDRSREQYPDSANLDVETDNESSSETLAEVPTESDIHSDRHRIFSYNSSLLLHPMTVDQMSRHLREQYNHNRDLQTALNRLNVVNPYLDYQMRNTGHVNDGSQNIFSERSRTNPTSSRRISDKSRAHVVHPLDSDDG